MLRSALSVALVLSLGIGSISAQGVDPRLTARLDARTRTVVAAIIDSALAQNLPIEPLIDKALEGAAKRAGADRDYELGCGDRRLRFEQGRAHVLGHRSGD